MSFGRVLLKHLATLGFIGCLPVAPGTWASLFAATLFLLLKPDLPAQLLILLCTIPIGTVASHHAENLLKEKDSRRIVIDEFAGYAGSVLALPPDFPFYLAAFLFFRFFD